MNLHSLLSELRRRRVFRVAAAYLVAAWVVVQVAGTVLPMLEAPIWVGKVALALVVLGFPVALVLAWAFDLTWEGIQRTEAIAPAAPGTTLLPRLVLLGLLPLVGAGGWLAWRWAAAPAESLDARVVAVLPFRVAGAEPGLAYLREGMLDLLAAKMTGEAGTRAVDPRTLTSAWRRAARGGAADLSREEALALARGLGAGRLVLGEVVSLPGRVVLTASLTDVARGRADAPVSVEGPVDSLPALVDRLVAGLLSVGAGEGERLASLTTTSLPALRQYLEGQAAYRGGRYDDAFTHFSRAVEADSTFALGALMLGRTAEWLAGPQRAVGTRALALAWAHRERLGERDRLLLTTVAGPNYPGHSSTVELLGALNALVGARPDDPEAWFELGELLLHEGPMIDIPEPTALRQAADAFERALALDSLYLPALQHLVDIAAIQGDTAAARRYADQYLARDSIGLAADAIRQLRAAQLRGMAALPEILARVDSIGGRLRIFTLDVLNFNAATLPIAHRAVDHFGQRMGEPEIARGLGHFLYALAMNGGSLAGSERFLQAARQAGQLDSLSHLRMRVRDGLHWEGDPEAAARAAAVLTEQVERLPAARRDTETLCVLGQWRLRHEERAAAIPLIEQLRARAGTGTSASEATALRCAELLDGWRAAGEGAPDAAARLARLDSIFGNGRLGGRLSFEANLILAELLEAGGDRAGALRVLGRYPMHLSTLPAYRSTFLRERGRVAALVGDTITAVETYRYYLALRADADPRLQPDVQRVRADLARLTGGGAR